MANQILLKRASGSDPTASDLALGEIAIRTDNGKLFTKKDNGTVAEISGAGGGNNFFINTLSSSSGSGGGSASFNGTATRFVLSNPPNLAAQLLVSIDGVIQKPNTGTSPSEGFAVDGNDIIFSSAPANGADFFIVTYASLAIAEPSDNTVTSAKIVDGAIVNADINASAAIARTKLANVDVVDDTSPQLGGNLQSNGNNINIADSTDGATNRLTVGSGGDLQIFHDSNGNNKISTSATLTIQTTSGTEPIIDMSPNGAVSLYHDNSKKFETTSAGIDVTGNISVSGTVDGVDIATRDTLFGGLTSSSGALTNGVTATTQSASDNSTKVATTAYTDTAISNLVNSAPSTLDTLNELAAALGDDPNFATTVTNSIATKLPLGGGTLTGNLSFSDNLKIKLGSSDDLQIYHSGAHSYIEDSGTGNLNILTNSLHINNPANTEAIARFNENGAVLLYYDNTLMFETINGGARVNGVLHVTSHLDMNDNDIIKLGNSDDLQIYHDGTDSKITNTTGALDINGSGNINIGKAGENGIKVRPDDAVELYYDNSKKLETTANGTQFDGRINFTGTGQKIDLIDNQEIRIGTGDDLTIYHNGTHSYIVDGGTGELRLGSNSGIRLTKHDSETVAFFDPDGACELYHDNSKKFETTANGVKVPDAVRIAVGDSEDAFFYHNGAGSDGAISNTVGNFLIYGGGGQIYLRPVNTENALIAKPNEGVELYYDASKKFETTSTGVLVTGNLASTGKVFSDELVSATQSNGHSMFIKARNAVGNEATLIKGTIGGSVELYHNSSKKFETTNAGFALKEGNTTRMSFSYSNSLNFITANAGNEIKVSSGNGDANGIEFWDYTGVNKRCQIDGHGIKFNADTAQANALDDYEEGTFQVSVTNGATNVTYESNGRNGSYTKIGRFVFFTLRIHMANSNGNNNIILITGLPFTAKSFSHDNNVAGGADPFYQDGFYNANDFSGIVTDGDTRIELVKRSSGAALTGNDVNRGREFRMTGTYMT